MGQATPWKVGLHWRKIEVSTVAILAKLLNDSVAQFLGPVGYVAGILAVNPVLPQAQHMESMFQQSISFCLATSATLLELYCVVKAREATTKDAPILPGASTDSKLNPLPYNSSAAVTAGVWLVLLTFLVSSVRSAKPSLMKPCINFAVVVVVTSSIAPVIPNMSLAINFAVQMLTINALGLAVSAVTGLLIWPTTNRGSFQDNARQLIHHMEHCLSTQVILLEADLNRVNLEGSASEGGAADWPAIDPTIANDIALLNTTLLATFSQMQTDIAYSSNEMTIGRLSGSDLSQLHSLLSQVLDPIIGLISTMSHAVDVPIGIDHGIHTRTLQSAAAHAKQAHQVFSNALRYALISLGQDYRPTKFDQLEAASGPTGVTVATLAMALQELRATNAILTGNYADTQRSMQRDVREAEVFYHLQSQELSLAACSAAMDVAAFAERRTQGDQCVKTRLIFPEILIQLLTNTKGIPSTFSSLGPDWNGVVGRGKARLRDLPYILDSPHAGFAVRIACAVLCSQLPVYLHQSQRWYTTQRVVWTSITVAVATNRRIGQSIFGVLCQLAGTLAGCLLSLLSWYIVDRKLPGVMVIYFLGMMAGAYPGRKSPSLAPLSSSTTSTLTLLVGYELESERVGEAIVSSLGQPYYPPYILSWLNLLAILAGVGIAFFWTLFPFPLLESHELPEQFGSTISMLAEFHTKAHVAVYHSISQRGGRDREHPTWAQGLSAHKVQIIKRLTSLQALLAASHNEFRLGRYFPRETYVELLGVMEKLFRSLYLIAYFARAFESASLAGSPSAWLQRLRQYAAPDEEIELRLSSTLAACGASIAHNQPLPPFLDVSTTSILDDIVVESLTDLLHPGHAREKGYRALTAIHTSALLAVNEMKNVLRLTNKLVGKSELESAEFLFGGR